MTEDYKELLLKYLTGNITEEEKSNTLNYEELNTTDQEDLGFDTPYTISDYLECTDGNGVPNGKTIVYGNVRKNNVARGFIALFKGTELLFYTTEYNTGTEFGQFKTLSIDESGQLYGIDFFNDKYRFILLNNVSELSKAGQRQVVLRQSYYLQGSTQLADHSYSFFYVSKSTQSASYIIVGASSDFPHVIAATNLKINVGAANEWVDYDVQVELNNESTFIPLNLYVYFDKNDTPNVSFYYINGISGFGNVLQVIKSADSTFLNSERLMNNLESLFGSGGALYSGERLIPTGIDSFFFFLSGYTVSGSNKTPKIFIVDFKSGIRALYEKTASSSGATWQVYPSLRFFKLNDTISIYLTMPVDPATTEIEQTVGIIATYEDNLNLIKVLPSSISSSYSNIVLFTSNYNMFNFAVIYTDTNNDYKLTSWKIVFNSSNYNNEPYENTNSLIEDNALLFDTNNNLIFARNLYNYKVYNNRVISVLNVPNTYLNDTTINKETLLSQTNKDILENTSTITKNIYEDLYINNFITLNMENQNEDIYITNKAGSINLTQSAFKNGDYENAKATKMRITYDDDSTLMTSTSATINNGIGTYDISVYIPSDKTIDHIDIMSEDENIVYQTITNETISKLNLQNNKYYHITQNVHVE